MTPANMNEYNERFLTNMQVTGYGITGTTQHMPCPFCAAPDWYVVKLMDFGHTSDPLTCGECGRTAQLLYAKIDGGSTMELVQTDGPDAPEWLQPPPRRAEIVAQVEVYSQPECVFNYCPSEDICREHGCQCAKERVAAL